MNNNCSRCGADITAPNSTNSEDSTLENLLQKIVVEANVSGICQLGQFEQIYDETGAIDQSQNYHTERRNGVLDAMEAVHTHIRNNYEEDD